MIASTTDTSLVVVLPVSFLSVFGKDAVLHYYKLLPDYILYRQQRRFFHAHTILP